MTAPFPITIFHNPGCGTSRNTLAMIRAAGYQPDVVLYLETGWRRAPLLDLLARMGAGPRVVLREKGTPAAEVGLLDPGGDDERLLAAMLDHPILVNRPIVVTPKGARLCRPSELVLDLMEHRPAGFTKADGAIVPPGTG